MLFLKLIAPGRRLVDPPASAAVAFGRHHVELAVLVEIDHDVKLGGRPRCVGKRSEMSLPSFTAKRPLPPPCAPRLRSRSPSPSSRRTENH